MSEWSKIESKVQSSCCSKQSDEEDKENSFHKFLYFR